MEMKLWKLLPLVGALCLGLTSSVFGHSNYQNGNGSSTYGSSTDSSSNQGNYQRGTFREITPNAGPRVAHGADVFLTADFIWWKVSEENLAFSGTGVNFINLPADTAYTSPPKGKIVYVGEDWAPGFKVGLGLNMGHDGWDLYAQYTWLHASHSKSQSGNNVYPAEFIPLEDSQLFDATITRTKNTSNWGLHFNVIDLELGRNFYLSQFLTMRPHIGLKGTWQNHDWKAKYFQELNVSFSDTQATVGFTGPLHDNKHYEVWGIGVRGGFNIAWYMSKCWSIYGNLALSTLWTNYYKSTQKIDVDDTTTGNTRGLVNIDNNNVYTCKYIAELELGLRWETWFYDDNYHFAIQAGWEQQTWINWSKFPLYRRDVYSDFSVQGLNLKFRFDF